MWVRRGSLVIGVLGPWKRSKPSQLCLWLMATTYLNLPSQYPVPSCLPSKRPPHDKYPSGDLESGKQEKQRGGVHCTCGVAHFHILLVAAFKVCRRRPSPISCDITPSVATSSCNTVLCVVDQGKVKVDHETMFAMIIEVH